MRPGDPHAVENLFNDVAPIYDLLNDVLSLGLHRAWKRHLISCLSPMPGERWLDLCCGTGDLALALARKVCPYGSVVGIDSASEPLAVARKRSQKEPKLPVDWIKGDALDTEFSSNYFDGAVMAYGLRNLTDPKKGLKELNRILKPGARAGILDFNQLSAHSNRAKFQKFYLQRVVVPTAAKFGLREHYAYLEESLKRFPRGSVQEDLALDAGFDKAKHQEIAIGLMGILLIRN